MAAWKHEKQGTDFRNLKRSSTTVWHSHYRMFSACSFHICVMNIGPHKDLKVDFNATDSMHSPSVRSHSFASSLITCKILALRTKKTRTTQEWNTTFSTLHTHRKFKSFLANHFPDNSKHLFQVLSSHTYFLPLALVKISRKRPANIPPLHFCMLSRLCIQCVCNV